ncbi:hypothetical protein JSY54_004388 [Salmonella enterica]|nr:hypothetical protein [Salmonella enterica]
MNFLSKFLGGLKGCDYFRHFFFGAVISFIFFYIAIHSANRLELGQIIFFIMESMKKCGAITEQVFCWSWNNQHPLVTMFVIP